MKTEHIMPAVGIFTTGIFCGVIFFALSLIKPYRSAVNEAHWAKEVITECINQYPDFYDTIAESDAYSEWVEYVNK